MQKMETHMKTTFNTFKVIAATETTLTVRMYTGEEYTLS